MTPDPIIQRVVEHARLHPCGMELRAPTMSRPVRARRSWHIAGGVLAIVCWVLFGWTVSAAWTSPEPEQALEILIEERQR